MSEEPAEYSNINETLGKFTTAVNQLPPDAALAILMLSSHKPDFPQEWTEEAKRVQEVRDGGRVVVMAAAAMAAVTGGITWDQARGLYMGLSAVSDNENATVSFAGHKMSMLNVTTRGLLNLMGDPPPDMVMREDYAARAFEHLAGETPILVPLKYLLKDLREDWRGALGECAARPNDINEMLAFAAAMPDGDEGEKLIQCLATLGVIDAVGPCISQAGRLILAGVGKYLPETLLDLAERAMVASIVLTPMYEVWPDGMSDPWLEAVAENQHLQIGDEQYGQVLVNIKRDLPHKNGPRINPWMVYEAVAKSLSPCGPHKES